MFWSNVLNTKLALNTKHSSAQAQAILQVFGHKLKQSPNQNNSLFRVNVCVKVHGNPCISYWDVSVWSKVVDNAIPRATLSWSLLFLFLLSNWHNLVLSKQGTKSHNGHGMLALHLSYIYSCHRQTENLYRCFLILQRGQSKSYTDTRGRP